MPSPHAAENFQLETFFPYRVRIFYRAVSEAVREVYASAFGLSVNEWRTLVVLNEYQPLSAGEIVTRSSMDKVNVSRAIASLQTRKLLRRHTDPTDRRRVLLQLTPKSRKLLSDLIPKVIEIEARMWNGLEDNERATLLQLMDKIRDNAENAAKSWAEAHTGNGKGA